VVLGVVPRSWSFLTDLLPSDSQFSQMEELVKLVSKLPVRVVFLLDGQNARRRTKPAAEGPSWSP
jgi:hypothetical protein